MFIQTILGILFAQFVRAQFTGCDYFKNASPSETFYISSPGYSNFYEGNTNCRFAITAPVGNTLYMNCYDMLLPSSYNCVWDRLEVSLSGRTDLADATRYCGGSSFTLQTSGNKMVVALRIPFYTPGGRFKCQITAIPPPCECGRRKTTRIVGGQPTIPNEFPMMAGLVDLDMKQVYCGSTIISNYHGLTAAHCVIQKKITNIALLVGDQDYKESSDSPYTKLMILASFTIHQSYTPRPISNDIALVRTKEEIVFNAGVGPVCLPLPYSTATFDDFTVEATGWGTLDFGGELSSNLQKVALNVIKNSQCVTALPTSAVTNSQICTFTADKDTCQSDSGGPLFYTNPKTGIVYQIGIVSYGITCASNKPSVSTRVTSYLKWIQDNTPGVNYCFL